MNARSIEGFQSERETLNDIVMRCGDLGIKRFFSLDSPACRAGASPRRRRNCWVSWPLSSCDAMTASSITSSSATRRESPAMSSWRGWASVCSWADRSPSRTLDGPSGYGMS